MSKKFDAALVLGRRYVGVGEWLDDLTKLRSEINKLRDLRNRIAHDLWTDDTSTPSRLQFTTSVSASKLSLERENEVDPKDIRAAYCKIVMCQKLLGQLIKAVPQPPLQEGNRPLR